MDQPLKNVPNFAHYSIKWNIFLAAIAIFLVFPSLSACSPGYDSTHQIFHFHGEDTSSWLGYFIKSLGDMNNDGFDDFAISSQSPRGTYLFLGGYPIDSFPDYFLNYFGPILDFRDYTGDGNPDFVMSSDYKIYLFNGHGDYIDTLPFDSILPPEGLQHFRGESSGLIDDNFIGDIIVHAEDPTAGYLELLYLNPFASDKEPDWIYALPDLIYSINHAGLIDFNGDSLTDIYMSMWPRFDSIGYAYIFLGPDYGSEPDIIIGPAEGVDTLPKYFARGVFNIGDVNGDGWEDLGLMNWSTTLVYLGGPMYDTLYDFQLDGMCYVMRPAGDVNGDGFNDLILGGSDSFDGRAIIYLGGPKFDGIRDEQIDRSDLPPLFLEYIGMSLSPGGDFNGDGIDDILFTCRNFAHGHPGDVFVFSGGGDITVDVEYQYEPTIPGAFELKQNYPNPFNPSTAIEFELRRKDVLTLDIYNILGQKVETLFSGRMFPAGTHTVYWDGTKQDGSPLPSGIYFYRISGNGLTESRKMVLLK